MTLLTRFFFLVSLGLWLWAAVKIFLSRTLLPIHTIRLETPVLRVPKEGIMAACREAPRDFFSGDLAFLYARIASLPFVRKASVKRLWPDTIVISIDEYVPVARLDDHTLVSAHGEIFFARTTELLPKMAADAKMTPEWLDMYRLLEGAARREGISLAVLAVNPRGSWDLQLKDGVFVRLGKDAVVNRFLRFLRVRKEVEAILGHAPARVDLRYPKGMAVGGTG